MTPERKDLELYVDDIPAAAKKYRCSTRTIRRWMQDRGIYQPKKGYGPGKLGLEKAEKIRQLHATGQYTQQDLASIFDVTQAMIGRVINNVAYKKDFRLTGQAIVRRLDLDPNNPE